MVRAKDAVEREVKLAVWPGFALPPLEDVAEGIRAVPIGEKRQEALYYDTPDMRLARSELTLRHRSDDGWTLKLPDDAPLPATGALSRREVNVDDDPRAVPPVIRSLVAAHVRTSVLGPVARLQTVRHRTDLLDAGGAKVAEVVDDEVSVLDGRRVALRFREVEVEVLDGAPDGMLEEVVSRLRAAGAGAPERTPKVMRALGPPAQAPPELAERPLGVDPTAAEVLRAGLVRAVRRLLEHDPLLRTTEDDEAVHQARVATRRLRSDLRTYGELLDGAWVGPLREELKWLADVLGAVRDADVLTMRLARQLEGLRRPERVVGLRLLDLLGEERGRARAGLLEALDAPRYLALLDRLVEGAEAPRTTSAADAPAADVLPRLVAAPWRALEKGAERIRPGSPDGELHEVRIRAKRARYAADVAALVVGKPAARLADAIAGVQEVLGEHQDACVARDWLQRAALEVDAPVAFVAGQLAARQEVEADARRQEFPAAWQQARKGKLRSWLER